MDDKGERATARAEVLEARAEAKVDAKAGSLERWQAGMVSIARWLFGSSTVGTVGALPSLAFDQTGKSGAIIWFLTSLVGIYGSLRSQRAAGRRADLLAEAEGIAARLKAESDVNYQALLAERRKNEECEARYRALEHRFDKLESQHAAMNEKIDALRHHDIDELLSHDRGGKP